MSDPSQNQPYAYQPLAVVQQEPEAPSIELAAAGAPEATSPALNPPEAPEAPVAEIIPWWNVEKV